MAKAAWVLARAQHWVISRAQLLDLGYSRKAIEHRLATGRLHRVYPGVYAVGRRQLTQRGHWMAAVLRCGDGAVLSHTSAASLWGIRTSPHKPIHVSVPATVVRRQSGVVVHRRSVLTPDHVRMRQRIPLTSVPLTLVDLAPHVTRDELEAAISEADKLELCDPESLRERLENFRDHAGVGKLRETLDRRTLAMTDSQLERRFLRLVKEAGLPRPLTQQVVNGARVDFYWPDLGLVVETDGLRHHRTASSQSRDLSKDHMHLSAGLTAMRCSHEQVRFHAASVRAILRRVAAACRERRGAPPTRLD